ncbi:hypothetical protein ACF0H5_014611 [Mactra antiquata]
MEGKCHYDLRWCTKSQWMMIVILVILPYSELVPNCEKSDCASCTGKSPCDECNVGYYLNDGNCHPCVDSKCATCSDSSCTVSIDGYYLNSGSCASCANSCLLCTDYMHCTKCKDTYWGVDIECSHTCSTNCANKQCDEKTGFCNQCESEKYGPKCEQDCNLCRDRKCDLRKCTNGCKDGYYQYNTNEGYSYCMGCSNNCIRCSNGSYCIQCEQGYYRNPYHVLDTGNGNAYCIQCIEMCEPVNPGTNKSTHETCKSLCTFISINLLKMFDQK